MTTIPLSDEQEEGELPDIYEREDDDPCELDFDLTLEDGTECEVVTHDQTITSSEGSIEDYIAGQEILDQMRD